MKSQEKEKIDALHKVTSENSERQGLDLHFKRKPRGNIHPISLCGSGLIKLLSVFLAHRDLCPGNTYHYVHKSMHGVLYFPGNHRFICYHILPRKPWKEKKGTSGKKKKKEYKITSGTQSWGS